MKNNITFNFFTVAVKKLIKSFMSENLSSIGNVIKVSFKVDFSDCIIDFPFFLITGAVLRSRTLFGKKLQAKPHLLAKKQFFYLTE